MKRTSHRKAPHFNVQSFLNCNQDNLTKGLSKAKVRSKATVMDIIKSTRKRPVSRVSDRSTSNILNITEALKSKCE